jgi:hypothetical protein
MSQPAVVAYIIRRLAINGRRLSYAKQTDADVPGGIV